MADSNENSRTRLLTATIDLVRANGYAATRVVRRESLAPVEGADGPMIVESMDSTVVVPPEWSLRASENGILDVTRR